jgi:hypothetical protein
MEPLLALPQLMEVAWEVVLVVMEEAKINMANNNTTSKLPIQEVMRTTPLLKCMLHLVEKAAFQLAVATQSLNLKRTFTPIERSNINKINMIMYSGSRI